MSHDGLVPSPDPPFEEYTCPRAHRSPYLTRDLGLPPTLLFFSHPSKSHELFNFDDMPHKHRIRRANRSKLLQARARPQSSRNPSASASLEASAYFPPSTFQPLRPNSAVWAQGPQRWDSSHHVTFSRANEMLPPTVREYFPRQPVVPPASRRLHQPSFNPLSHMQPSMFQQPIGKPLPMPKFREDLLQADPLHGGAMGALRKRHFPGGTARDPETGEHRPWNNNWNSKSKLR